MPLVTPLPTPPNSNDTVNFNSRADSFLGALPTLATEVNSVGTNMETQYNYVVANVSTTATSAAQATTAANSAVSAKNSIEVLFLGSKASNPSTNNSGGALIVGTRYFNTTVGEDRVWTGTNWVSSTAIGGTVSSLNVDGTLKLKKNVWLLDSDDNERVFFESSGSGSALTTFLKGNNLSFRSNDNTDKFIVSGAGDTWALGRVGFNVSGFGLLPYNSVTVGNQNGGGSTIGLGISPLAQGAWGQLGAYSDETYLMANTYYALGADRFSATGYYAPKIRLLSVDNSIKFQQTEIGTAGYTQTTQNIARFDPGGSFIVNSRNGYGWVSLQGGGTGNTGLVTFFRQNGERTGYTGYAVDAAGSDNVIAADNGHAWRFTGMAPLSSVDATTADALPRLSQFTSSQAANGNTKLPNGLILQWCAGSYQSSEGNQTVTFPIAFPNNCFSVSVTCQVQSVGNGSDAWYQLVSTTLTNCVVYNQNSGSNGNIRPVIWAVGN